MTCVTYVCEVTQETGGGREEPWRKKGAIVRIYNVRNMPQFDLQFDTSPFCALKRQHS